MRAIVLEKAGGVENLVMKDVPRPVPQDNEVLVEVKAIGINPVDFKVRKSEERITRMFGGVRPFILGWDIAGTVAAAGDKAALFKTGDKVFGMVNFPGRGNAYAELVAAPESHLAKMPENVSFEKAAAATLAALTALQALQGRVKKGDRVLIHAGSGGVGHFAIQIAKYLGAYVVTTSSAKNRDFVVSLGADEHIDYRKHAFEEIASGIDFVLDSMGGEVLLRSLKAVKEGGTVITLTSPPPFIEEARKKAGSVIISPLLVQSNGKDMNTLRELLEKGVLIPHVSKTFSFSEIRRAHTEAEGGRTVGKAIVTL
jgi:NADPH:quinone reductase-like Zn-dependent oxidoreductase